MGTSSGTAHTTQRDDRRRLAGTNPLRPSRQACTILREIGTTGTRLGPVVDDQLRLGLYGDVCLLVDDVAGSAGAVAAARGIPEETSTSRWWVQWQILI